VLAPINAIDFGRKIASRLRIDMRTQKEEHGGSAIFDTDQGVRPQAAPI
jgi:hypothetical protein